MDHSSNHLDRLRNRVRCDGIVLWHVVDDREIRPISQSWQSEGEAWQQFCAEASHVSVLSRFLRDAETSRTCAISHSICQRADLFRLDGVHGLFIIEALWGTAAGSPEFEATQNAVLSEQMGSSDLVPLKTPNGPSDDAMNDFGEFVQSLHQSLDLVEAATLAANAARQFCDSQRVSIAVQRGAALKLIAVSGSDRVLQKSEEVRLLSTLAEAVFRSGTELRWSSGNEDFVPAMKSVIADYVQTSHTRSMSIRILTRRNPVVRDDSPATRRRTDRQPVRALGVIIFEQFDSASVSDSTLARQRIAAVQIEQSLSNALTHSSVFLRRPLLAAGRMLSWFRGRRLAIGAAISIFLTLFAIACFVVPWEYRVSCDGELMPNEHMTVFAPWEGQVVEVFVEHNDQVSSGQPLLRLRNDDLQQEFVAATSKVAELQKLLRSYAAQLNVAGRSGTKDEAVRIQGELTRTRIELAGAEEQTGVLKTRMDSLLVSAPRDGVVATFDLRHSFQDRPVSRGERLIEIFNPEGDWHLELRIPDHRSRYVADAMQISGNQVSVEFVMATDVSRTHAARLTSTATIVDTSETEGLVVRAFARIPELSSIGPKQFGSEVHTKIDCGKEPLGWCLFGDVIEFVQRHVWL